ncbi:MAG: GtrA family protein [Actinomycetota bacterium]
MLQTAVRWLSPGQWRFLRYASVSAITIVITQAVLLGGISILDLSGGVANVLAVCIGALPNYLLNRAWVWEKTGPHHVWREIVPFWVYAVLGLVVSTIVVSWADARWGTGLAASAANLGTYFVLWIAKFLLLDKLLFGGPTNDVPA